MQTNGTSGPSADDALPSWNEGAIKHSILNFVTRAVTEADKDYVPPSDRIAVFDNDGTLWAEQPMYCQLAFALDRVKALTPQHPEWATTEPFASLLGGDLQGALTGGEPAFAQIVVATHAGMTTEEFGRTVQDWIATAKHPKTARLYSEMAYQPMLELLGYLRASGFRTFIFSGGGAEFMRVFAETVYGIPPEQVIGSTGKPAGIHKHIGRRPILAFGNSDGDLQMLQWTAAGGGERFMGLVHHTDAEREWAYDRTSHIGTLDTALDEAIAKGWAVVDVKRDWKNVFAFETRQGAGATGRVEPARLASPAPATSGAFCSGTMTAF